MADNSPLHDDDICTVGWDAISAACGRVYPGVEPLHTGPVLHYRIGGNDPLDGISIYKATDPTPHWHFVSYGMSELYRKEGGNPDVSGWGFEFTFRLIRSPEEKEPPAWAFGLMQNLARYVFNTGNVFEAGHHLDANGPICIGSDTAIRAIAFVQDADLGEIRTPNGRVEFLQIVGLTLDEYEAILAWESRRFLKLLGRSCPKHFTDLDRTSILTEPVIARSVQSGMRRHGSGTAALFPSVLEWAVVDKTATITVGANGLRRFAAVVRGRIPFGRPLLLFGPKHRVRFVPADSPSWQVKDEALEVHVTPELAEELAATFADPLRGTYSWPALPKLTVEVVPSEIRDATGAVVKTVG